MGIIFQENGLYNAHVSYVNDKCLKRINLLRMLKGTSWGVSKDPLLCMYRALIRPIIEYGMEIYFNSSDSTLKQIEKIQTECLRICAGAMRSTPINCLQVHCNEMPLKLKFEQLCLNFRAYLGTFANHPSSSVVQNSWQERFPDNPGFCSFNMRTKGFFDKPNMNLNAIVLPDIPIWLIDKPVIDLNIFFLCRKNDNTNLIRSCFSYVINTDYADFTLLFTDGSKSQHGTSSGFFAPQTNTKRSIAINSLGSAFSAELYAILSALHWIAINRPWKSLVVTDCYSVLQALNSKKWGKHYILNKILLLNHYLTNSNLKVTFLWVPSHSGISGNEIADNLTKHVFRSVVQCSSNDVQIKRVETKLSYSEVKSFIRDHIYEKWNRHYIAYPAGGQYKILFPNVQNVPSFQSKEILRLQTAHCCLNQHLFRINCHDTGLCSKCKVPETVPHFLFVCPNYSTDRNILKSAVEKLGLNFDLKSVLSNKVVYPHLIHYICSSNRFI